MRLGIQSFAEGRAKSGSRMAAADETGADVSDAYYHADALQRELDAMERGAASMERQLDRVEAENARLRQEIAELKLEISRLGGTP